MFINLCKVIYGHVLSWFQHGYTRNHVEVTITKTPTRRYLKKMCAHIKKTTGYHIDYKDITLDMYEHQIVITVPEVIQQLPFKERYAIGRLIYTGEMGMDIGISTGWHVYLDSKVIM